MGKDFLLKVSTKEFKLLFPERKPTLQTFNENNEIVVMGSIKIPEGVISCDYGCNQNLVDHDYFYLLMIDEELCRGTVCKECYSKSFTKLPIISFKAISC